MSGHIRFEAPCVIYLFFDNKNKIIILSQFLFKKTRKSTLLFLTIIIGDTNPLISFFPLRVFKNQVLPDKE